MKEDNDDVLCTLVYCILSNAYQRIKITIENISFLLKTSHVYSVYHRKILDFFLTECEEGDVRSDGRSQRKKSWCLFRGHKANTEQRVKNTKNMSTRNIKRNQRPIVLGIVDGDCKLRMQWDRQIDTNNPFIDEFLIPKSNFNDRYDTNTNNKQYTILLTLLTPPNASNHTQIHVLSYSLHRTVIRLYSTLRHHFTH